MHKYDAILFDLDDTLIDNDESIKYAIFDIYSKLGIPCNDETFLRWKQFDIDYWFDWENGTIEIPKWADVQHLKIDFLRANRFVHFFKEFNISYEDAVKINNYYISLLPKNIIPIEGANDFEEWTVFEDNDIVILEDVEALWQGIGCQTVPFLHRLAQTFPQWP